ncbi:hypothetical protein BDW59DRAFT_144998 [Aspergillus cavernicola]|uniref:Zn(2)-C6 fungal-type domain-containing protein n=1 Tax=Aspergillus cavernicola TaxID=176166 RepID=A0ABR4IFZ4_9EURO
MTTTPTRTASGTISMPAPTPSPAPATVSTGHEDLPLRNSCGNCNQAKVRCSKDRPTCRRCASRNTSCVYGVSLRGMKRPRADGQADEASQPTKKKRATPVPSPVSSDILPTTSVDIAGQTTGLPDWSSEFYAGTLVHDGLGGILPFDTFQTPPLDQPPFSFPLSDTNLPSPPTQAWVGPHMDMALPSLTIPLSPISPPASRDGQIGSLPSTSCSTSSGSCCCQQNISFKLTEVNTPNQPGASGLNEFLTEHRANMALCTTVLDCSDPQHKAGMLLLVELIALLFHMVGAFDQILQQGGEKNQPPTYPHAPTSSDHRKEQVVQANLLRAELAKLGAMIQNFDRRYCTLDSASWGEDTFLLSPLFVNLQWKTQAKFDAARSWMPWL